MAASIKVKNLCLDVPTFEQQDQGAPGWASTLLGAVAARKKRRFRRLLDDITFTLNEGDRLALIGRNGAGKSTLLRVLTGAYVPTQGTMKVEGSRQALLNIKLGFNNHATLVENIYLRGTAMGISNKMLRQLVRPVLGFAGLEAKAQDRLYTLSSGQRMRLGFAIATAVGQDILLTDEWLGAGDAAFIERARERMNDRVGGSKIVVLASHNAKMVRHICNKGMVLRDGRIDYFGDIDSALQTYRREIRADKKALKAKDKAVLQRLHEVEDERAVGSKSVPEDDKAVRKPATEKSRSARKNAKNGKPVGPAGKISKTARPGKRKKRARSNKSGKPADGGADPGMSGSQGSGQGDPSPSTGKTGPAPGIDTRD